MELLKRLWQLFVARNKEFYRDRGSMTWNMLFPILIIGGFAFAYGGKPKPLFSIGIVERGETTTQHNPLSDWKYARFVKIEGDEESLSKAKEKVSRHQLDLLIDIEEAPVGGKDQKGANWRGHFWVNPTSPQGDTLEKMLASVKEIEWTRESTVGQEVRFVDWLTPGIIGINMMFSALFGVGYVLVRYRKSGVLKRLKATPVRAWEFLLAQIFSRFVLIAISSAMIFTGAVLILGIPLKGSPLALAIVLSSGTLCLISLGLLVAARVSSEELAGGLLNLMTWPMMFLSGVWFSLEGLNPWLQRVSQLSPLTHMVSASRAIMIDGAHWYEPVVLGPIAILLTIAVIGLGVGSWMFRWE
jgi:ABC-2 type transport system permease protein